MHRKMRSLFSKLDSFMRSRMSTLGVVAYTASLFAIAVPVVLVMAFDGLPVRIPAGVLLAMLVALGLYLRSASMSCVTDNVQKLFGIANTALLQLTVITMTAGSVLAVRGDPDAATVSGIGQVMAGISILMAVVLLFWKELFHKDDDGPSGPVGMA